ncbi:MAG TPA: hypothetical protein VEZ24_08820 [Microvirga sp.]|nr:hypothetical protein [Microvirga sp.]
MRVFWIVLGVIGGSILQAHAQPWGPRGECPPNTRPRGAFCQLAIPDSIRNTGICPADYVSTSDGAYCVLAPKKEWVRVQLGCPVGYQPSPGGEFCIEK